MRMFTTCLFGFIASLSLCVSANAAVEITIDKNAQMMTVAVDGVARYNWKVSTGTPSHETPNGSFRTFRMEADHYSKEWDDAPMPHSIFFTKRGHAIHGTDSVNRLGSPASHGCVRLSREHASTLFDLVKQEGVLNTTVTLTGSSRVAIARQRNSQTVANARNSATSASRASARISRGEGYAEVQPRSRAGRTYRQSRGYVYNDRYYYDGYYYYEIPRGRRIYRAQDGNYYYYDR